MKLYKLTLVKKKLSWLSNWWEKFGFLNKILIKFGLLIYFRKCNVNVISPYCKKEERKRRWERQKNGCVERM